MLERSPPRFHGKKTPQHFQSAVSKVVERVKSVAQWSANIRKLAKDHKGYGSATSGGVELFLLSFSVKTMLD